MARTLRFRVVIALASVALAACREAPTTPASRLASGPAAFSAQAAPEEVMGGEVIVAIRDGANIDAVAREHGLALGLAGYRNAFFVLRGQAGNERGQAAELASDPRVAYAEPNFAPTPTVVDPKLWAFYNPGGLNMSFTSGKTRGQPLPSSYASTSDADEDNVERLRCRRQRRRSRIDRYGCRLYASGIRRRPADRGQRLVRERQRPERRRWSRDAYHRNDGGDNGRGCRRLGAAAHVKVYVQSVCGRRGCPTSAIVSAIRAAADFGVVAMNFSLGGSSESQAEKDAIAYATSKNVLVIASAGNNGTATVECPACDPNAISVSATTWQDKLASYSSYGPGLDIGAPGGQCYSNTSPEGCIYSAYLGGGYAWLQGTSMAAPQVTGTAAIVASTLGLRGSALRARV